MEASADGRRLAAILSADVAGYSRLMAADEAATIQRLTEYREAIAVHVRQHNGRVVDSPGDNLLAEFPSALDAVRCAIDTQGVLGARNAGLAAERRMDFRMGVHLGDVTAEGERIYGDGVNIAARLEQLADSGGLCISSSVHDQVRHKLGIVTEDLGEKSVKNIPDPVRVFRVRLGEKGVRVGGASGRRLPRILLAALVVLTLLGSGVAFTWPLALGWVIDLAGLGAFPENPALPEGPSLAVLPFTNMSGDPEQEYFSDGLSEDLTTDLSKHPFLFVVARNSAFAYKGGAVDIEQVGRELGVRYVLEGSVRRVNDRVRVTAQLIDVASGFHIWSERYDRQLADIFALQAEISQEILAAVGLKIGEAEQSRARRKPTENLTAYDLLQKALYHFNRFTRQDNLEARRLLERALELDPNYAVAHSLLGATYSVEHGFLWTLDPSLRQKARKQAERALELDPSIPGSYTLMAGEHLFNGRPAAARAAVERAIELAPSFHIPYFFQAMAFAMERKPVLALQAVKQGLRLNPRAPSAFASIVPYVNLAAGRKAAATKMLEEVYEINPQLLITGSLLAGLYELEGRTNEAQAIVKQVLSVNPDLTADILMSRFPGLFDDELVTDLRAGLRRAGMP